MIFFTVQYSHKRNGYDVIKNDNGHKSVVETCKGERGANILCRARNVEARNQRK